MHLKDSLDFLQHKKYEVFLQDLSTFRIINRILDYKNNR